MQVTTACYQEAVQAILAGNYTPAKINDWQERLSSVYNRGFWEGYYLGHELGAWTKQPGSIATERKTYLGKGVKYFGKIRVGEFAIESGILKPGDEVMLLGNAHGMVRRVLDPLIVNGEEADQASKGDIITFPVDTKVTPGDKLYKILKADA